MGNLMQSDPLAAAELYRRYKAGELTEEEYRATLERPYTPPPPAPGYRKATWRAAARTGENRLTLEEVKRLGDV